MRGTAEAGQYRPLLLVSITIGSGSQDVWMLVDSGADFTTIPSDLAEAISGTPRSSLGKAVGNAIGVGGEVKQRVVEADLSYYNYARPHKTLGPKITPAMAAGISDHVWTVEEICRLLESN